MGLEEELSGRDNLILVGGLPGYAAIAGLTVVFGLALAVLSGWFALLIGDPEAAERVLFFPAIALAFISSAFAPVNFLAGWMQPIARLAISVPGRCGILGARRTRLTS